MKGREISSPKCSEACLSCSRNNNKTQRPKEDAAGHDQIAPQFERIKCSLREAAVTLQTPILVRKAKPGLSEEEEDSKSKNERNATSSQNETSQKLEQFVQSASVDKFEEVLQRLAKGKSPALEEEHEVKVTIKSMNN